MIPVKNLVNLSLRALTLASRFLFIFFLARYISPENLGLYGLFTATVGYALYFVGLDFYTYTTREIIKKDKAEWGGMLKNQAVLSAAMYLAFLPLSMIFFAYGLLPPKLAIWFFAILVLEHVNQEFGRVFIAVSEQVMSSIVLFLRQGSWAVAAVIFMVTVPQARSLPFIFGAWIIAGVVAVAASAYRLRKLQIGGWKNPLDWKWIKAGLVVCIPLLVATLALRSIQTVDRYWLQALVNTKMVGLYVLCMGIASTLLAFLDAGVFAYAYPALIRFFQRNQIREFNTQLRKMFLLTAGISAIFSLVSFLLLPYLFQWIGNDFYIAHQNFYGWVLLAMVINAVGLVPHYALYAQGRDQPIIISHLIGVAVFILATGLISRIAPLLAVPLGMIAAFGVILLWKGICFLDGAEQRFAAIRD